MESPWSVPSQFSFRMPVSALKTLLDLPNVTFPTLEQTATYFWHVYGSQLRACYINSFNSPTQSKAANKSKMFCS